MLTDWQLHWRAPADDAQDEGLQNYQIQPELIML
jgi:hypothetical protein